MLLNGLEIGLMQDLAQQTKETKELIENAILYKVCEDKLNESKEEEFDIDGATEENVHQSVESFLDRAYGMESLDNEDENSIDYSNLADDYEE